MLGVVGGASPPRVVDDGIVVPQLQGPLSGVGLDELSLEAAKATPAGKKSSCLRLACIILLVLAAAEVASLLTYYTLCAENHRWWWRAFLAPATTGLYVFGYAAYYYGAHLQDEAFDVLQAGLFFGYMALVALGVALVAGAAGFLASLKFLAYIFAQIKFD